MVKGRGRSFGLIRPAVASLLIPVLPMSGLAESEEYGWSVSSRQDSPLFVTDAPFVGERDVYVWVWCSIQGEISSATMDVTGSLEIVSFSPLNGVVQNGVFPTLDLQFPACQTVYSLLAGALTVRDSTGAGGEVCFTGTPVSRDCAPVPQEYPHSWTGFSTTGSFPCTVGIPCPIDIVVPDTWGRVKGEYAD